VLPKIVHSVATNSSNFNCSFNCTKLFFADLKIILNQLIKQEFNANCTFPRIEKIPHKLTKTIFKERTYSFQSLFATNDCLTISPVAQISVKLSN